MRANLWAVSLLLVVGGAFVGCSSSEPEDISPEPNQVVLKVEPLV